MIYSKSILSLLGIPSEMISSFEVINDYKNIYYTEL